MESSLKDSIVESEFNIDPDKMPIGLHNPASNGVVFWLANEVEEGFSSAFWAEENYEREILKADIFKDIGEIYRVRDELLKEGWRFMKPPTMKIKDTSGIEREPNRKERRYIAKKMDHFVKVTSKREGKR